MKNDNTCIYAFGSSRRLLREALTRVPREFFLRVHGGQNARRNRWVSGKLAGKRPIDDWRLIVVRDGVINASTLDWSGTLGPGSLTLINHRVLFGDAIESDEATSFFSFRFGFHSVLDGSHVQPSEEGVAIAVNLRPAHQLEQILLQLTRSHLSRNELSAGMQNALLFSVLHQIFEASCPESRVLGNERLNRIIDRLWEHPEERLTISEMAAMAGSSANTFLRHFKAATQLTPVDYQIRVRCQHAAHLLETSDFKLADIAEQLGYPDPYCLSKQFKKIFGMAPSRYRSSM